MRLDSLEEVLRFAIRKEADAAAFYRLAAERSNPGIKKAFEELVKEEEGHRKKLESLDLKKVGQMRTMEEKKGLGIAEAVEDVPFSSDMSYADLLRMAIKNEEKAYQLYTSVATGVTESSLKELLTMLAREEATHKERLEKIYDDDILKEF